MSIKSYRICENKYGWFKIQKWKPPFRLLWLIPILGRWVDAGYYADSNESITYTTKSRAKKQIEVYINNNEAAEIRKQRKNNSWVCTN